MVSYSHNGPVAASLGAIGSWTATFQGELMGCEPKRARRGMGGWRTLFTGGLCLVLVMTGFGLGGGLGVGGSTPAAAQGLPSYLDTRPKAEVDTALIISVDVSQSVDEERYALQMEGIARALEDPDVIGAIVSAPLGRILFMMIAWADSPTVIVPWTWIASPADARAAANLVRNVPQQGGEFTCLARMLRIVNETILPSMPKRARRVVLDVSSDGIDNCTPAPQVDEARDRLIKSGVMINGNPIMIPGENDTVGVGAYRKPGYGLAVGPDTEMTTMEKWYTAHVMGGPGAFVLPAYGYRDFGRAIRKKFMMEVTDAGWLPGTSIPRGAPVNGALPPVLGLP